jgi:hypothetical protein
MLVVMREGDRGHTTGDGRRLVEGGTSQRQAVPPRPNAFWRSQSPYDPYENKLLRTRRTTTNTTDLVLRKLVTGESLFQQITYLTSIGYCLRNLIHRLIQSF